MTAVVIAAAAPAVVGVPAEAAMAPAVSATAMIDDLVLQPIPVVVVPVRVVVRRAGGVTIAGAGAVTVAGRSVECGQAWQAVSPNRCCDCCWRGPSRPEWRAGIRLPRGRRRLSWVIPSLSERPPYRRQDTSARLFGAGSGRPVTPFSREVNLCRLGDVPSVAGMKRCRRPSLPCPIRDRDDRSQAGDFGKV